MFINRGRIYHPLSSVHLQQCTWVNSFGPDKLEHCGGNILSPVWCQAITRINTVTYMHHSFKTKLFSMRTLQWCHHGRDGVSNHQPHHCLLNRFFCRRSKKTSTLHVTDLCVPAQMVSNAEDVSIWWRHNEFCILMKASPKFQFVINSINSTSDWFPQICKKISLNGNDYEMDCRDGILCTKLNFLTSLLTFYVLHFAERT